MHEKFKKLIGEYRDKWRLYQMNWQQLSWLVDTDKESVGSSCLSRTECSYKYPLPLDEHVFQNLEEYKEAFKIWKKSIRPMTVIKEMLDTSRLSFLVTTVILALSAFFCFQPVLWGSFALWIMLPLLGVCLWGILCSPQRSAEPEAPLTSLIWARNLAPCVPLLVWAVCYPMVQRCSPVVVNGLHTLLLIVILVAVEVRILAEYYIVRLELSQRQEISNIFWLHNFYAAENLLQTNKADLWGTIKRFAIAIATLLISLAAGDHESQFNDVAAVLTAIPLSLLIFIDLKDRNVQRSFLVLKLKRDYRPVCKWLVILSFVILIVLTAVDVPVARWSLWKVILNFSITVFSFLWALEQNPRLKYRLDDEHIEVLDGERVIIEIKPSMGMISFNIDRRRIFMGSKMLLMFAVFDTVLNKYYHVDVTLEQCDGVYVPVLVNSCQMGPNNSVLSYQKKKHAPSTDLNNSLIAIDESGLNLTDASRMPGCQKLIIYPVDLFVPICFCPKK